MKKTSLIIFALLLLFSSCNKNSIPPIPALPPTSSLSMEFELLNEDKSANLFFENWLYSISNITVFSTISTANISIPAFAYGIAFTKDPTYIGDKTWQWSYDFHLVMNYYTATLNAKTDRNGRKTNWEMYITREGAHGFDDFLWFEGNSIDSTSANWTVYANHSAPIKVIETEWESDSNGEKSELKYTYYNANDDNNNSTIAYIVNNEMELDKTYNIYLSSTDASVNIEWSSEFNNGRVQSEHYYNNTDWHCWNEILVDTSCD